MEAVFVCVSLERRGQIPAIKGKKKKKKSKRAASISVGSAKREVKVHGMSHLLGALPEPRTARVGISAPNATQTGCGGSLHNVSICLPAGSPSRSD